MLSINFLAVFVASLAAFIIGFLFHGPFFGKLWMKLANIHPTGNEKLSDMIPQMLLNLLVNFVTAFVIAIIFSLVFTSSIMGAETWFRGAIMGIILWLGFLVTSSSIDVIWMGKSKKLWLFECFCSLVTMSVVGAILAAW